MSLTTHSKFYFGTEVTDITTYIDFDEGAGELTATLNVGSYSIEDLANEVSRALNAAGGQTYTVAFDRTTRKFTISAAGAFSLLIGTGSHSGSTAFTLIGYTGNDVGPATSHVGDSVVGSEYVTQFILQSFVDGEHQQGPVYSSINKSASGAVEALSFGNEKFIDMNIKFANNYAHGSNAPIRQNLTGVTNLVTFMKWLVTKAPVEFMRDESAPETFETLTLESTPDDKNGMKFKLKELYDRGLPGYFETGVLKFRVME